MEHAQSEEKAHAGESRPASCSSTHLALVTRSFQIGSSDKLAQPRRPNTTPKPRIQRILQTTSGQPNHRNVNNMRQTVPPPSTFVQLPNSPPRLESGSPRTLIKTHFAFVDETVETNPLPLGATRSINFDNGTENIESNSNGFDFSSFFSNSVNSDNDVNKSRPETGLESMEMDEENEWNESVVDHFGTNHEEETGVENVDDNDDYHQAIATRNQLLHDEADRQRIRKELELYVASLTSRTDENGDHVVEFPRNYHQVVSLMTLNDIKEEAVTCLNSQQTRQPSWSRVLLESGLSKQQAFGILQPGDEDDSETSGSHMTAKLALKMARIRQLDNILFEKLGKNLYSSSVPKKQKKRHFPGKASAQRLPPCVNGAEVNGNSKNSRETSPPDDDHVLAIKKSSNFIERNKQMVANGMKANMTKDEEIRLEKLLEKESNSICDCLGSESSTTTEVDTERNEFKMLDTEKAAIEKLLALKSNTPTLFAIDEDDENDEVLLHSDETMRSRKSTTNIIQETKRERLERHRLCRVEQELRFLHESPSMIIVGDDHDDLESDDCASERSYSTMASSTCSTRSGVISRYAFKCFLAQQKELFQATPTASTESIRQLLVSLGHGNVAPVNTWTTRTG